jgi:hypothetical protein
MQPVLPAGGALVSITGNPLGTSEWQHHVMLQHLHCKLQQISPTTALACHSQLLVPSVGLFRVRPC